MKNQKWGIKLSTAGRSLFVIDIKEVAGRAIISVDASEENKNNEVLSFDSQELATNYAERMGWILYRIAPI